MAHGVDCQLNGNYHDENLFHMNGKLLVVAGDLSTSQIEMHVNQ